MDKDIISVIEIGTSKIIVLIAELDCYNELNIIGIGEEISYGIKAGVVVSINSCSESIKKAIDKAEIMAGKKISSALIGISCDFYGEQVLSKTIEIKNSGITQADLDILIHNTKINLEESDIEPIHLSAQKYFINDHLEVNNPIGINSKNLAAEFYSISVNKKQLTNIKTCIANCGITNYSFALNSIASAHILSPEQKQAGVALVDIGAGKTNLIIYSENKIQYACFIPMGSYFLTNLLKEKLGIVYSQAEMLKKDYGLSYLYNTPDENVLSISEVRANSTKEFSKAQISEIIKMGMDEIIQELNSKIKTSGYPGKLESGIVFTGGGSMLNAFNEYLKNHVGICYKTIIGHSTDLSSDIRLNKAIYSSSKGLLKLAVNKAYQKNVKKE